jgi:hypothetical protein
MKISRVWIGLSVVAFMVSCLVVSADAESIEELLSRVGGETQLGEGLKEALKVGTGNAVKLVSQLDGFYKNDLIKIILPERLQKAEKLLRKAGFNELVDNFELSMNRAAEKAASSATDVFVEAITAMTIEDAVTIFKGEDNAATLYFQKKMTEPLTTKFTPIVETAMTEVGVTRLYQELEKTVTGLMPLGIGDMFKTDLPQYVTGKALDGLFYMVAAEEKKIREDPKARVTELLEKIFK